MDDVVSRMISPEELYACTGIQKAIYNTIYQLMAVKEASPEQLAKAKIFLMVPDYLHWKLCGVKANEYTEATTTQLIAPNTRGWDWELIRRLGYPAEIFQKVVQPGTVLGELTEEVAKAVGYCCKVVLPATHDTASAILAIPSSDSNTVYISSGTWSLLGVELPMPDCKEESRKKDYHTLSILGGGSNAEYLNHLTAMETGCTVYTGPSEATALGNALAQMISFGECHDIGHARQIVKSSFDVKILTV